MAKNSGINRSISIPQPSIFGRIGTGIGKGIAETLPKEIERQQMLQGLQEFAGDDPRLQKMAQLYGIRGITPQMVQTFGELEKIQNQGNAYRRSAGGGQPMNEGQMNQPRSSPNLNDINFANIIQKQNNAANQMAPQGEVNNLQQTPNQNANENIPQVIPGNPLNQQNLTRMPWTPQQRDSTIANYIDQGFLPDQARQLQQDDESRDLSEPAAYKQRLEDIDQAKGKVRDSLKRHLETKLQKSGENVFKDVEGRMILNAERGMTRDLIMNPKADIDNVANDWSERLYNTAIAKGKMKTLGETTGLESFLKGNSSEKKLKEYQDIFKRSGNLDEYKNILQGPGFGLSPSAAASFAYPPNSKINKKIDTFNPKSSIGLFKPTNKFEEARKIALEIENDIEPDDSVLAIARKLADKDPFFDQQAFIDQISEDKNEIGLNERQRLELAEGVGNILPNWGDLLYLPIFRR